MPAPLMPSVYARRELQAVVVSMKAIPRDVRRAVSKGTRETMNPVWREAVNRHATTDQQRKVLAKGARIAAGNPPRMVAASSRRQMRGGLRPADAAVAFEMGTARPDVRDYWQRRTGNVRDVVHGWPHRQLPRHRSGGHVVFPAVKDVAPRLVSLWVQTLMRKVADALDAEGR